MLIGIGSKARTGKSAAAAALVRDLGFTRVSFADPLKELALEADPIVYPQPPLQNMQNHNRLNWVVRGKGGWEEAKDSFQEVRRFLQALGVGARKVFGEDFWVDQAFRRAEGHANVVIPDVRFPNEAAAIRLHGGYLIRIDRPGQRGSLHESETALDEFTDWDFIVSNDATLADLEREVVDFVKRMERQAVA